ncbi:uncharacterized protein LOC127136167 [Lathyrus oleraceus]|uniref:uncharacterized protein LOC127136167 n=1 Tax=Pisum sativum TaxID=3888 RepID=UPI0021D14B63|nr:uncharacterized protein LOC127136167 [Pisum sativum]
MLQESGFSHGSISSSHPKYVRKGGLDARLMITWTDANPGCHFYGCDIYKVQGFKKCNHFVWLDEDMNPRAKELISAILNNINEEKATIKSYKEKEEELKMKVNMLKKQLKINWMLLFVMLFAFVGTTLMKYVVG